MSNICSRVSFTASVMDDELWIHYGEVFFYGQSIDCQSIEGNNAHFNEPKESLQSCYFVTKAHISNHVWAVEDDILDDKLISFNPLVMD